MSNDSLKEGLINKGSTPRVVLIQQTPSLNTCNNSNQLQLHSFFKGSKKRIKPYGAIIYTSGEAVVKCACVCVCVYVRVCVCACVWQFLAFFGCFVVYKSGRQRVYLAGCTQLATCAEALANQSSQAYNC